MWLLIWTNRSDIILTYQDSSWEIKDKLTSDLRYKHIHYFIYHGIFIVLAIHFWFHLPWFLTSYYHFDYTWVNSWANHKEVCDERNQKIFLRRFSSDLCTHYLLNLFNNLWNIWFYFKWDSIKETLILKIILQLMISQIRIFWLFILCLNFHI